MTAYELEQEVILLKQQVTLLKSIATKVLYTIDFGIATSDDKKKYTVRILHNHRTQEYIALCDELPELIYVSSRSGISQRGIEKLIKDTVDLEEYTISAHVT